MRSICLPNIPLPPSSNNQYKLFRRGNKTYHVPSDEFKAFKDAMSQYRHLIDLRLFQTYARDWKDTKTPLEITCKFYVHRKRIYSLSGTIKKWDVSNRLKSLHDCISKMLDIDDSLFFNISARKQAIDADLREKVDVEIYPIL
jgi:Holliday junction resolvase RusA-like endonuclease